MSTDLPCYYARNYWSVAESDQLPLKCIAPRKDNHHCGWSINQDDLSQARALRARISNLPQGAERDNLIYDWILLRCCVAQHRHKLEFAPNDALGTLVKRYAKELPVAPVKIENESAGMQLRSGTVMTSTSPATITPRKKPDYFIPYKTDVVQTMVQVLYADIYDRRINDSEANDGDIYCFVWPQYPGFIKIGYTGGRAEDRVAGWRKCHPGATLVKCAFVQYPKRIERLMHIEMALHRFRIGRCAAYQCAVSHEEWFKLPSADVGRLVLDWANLMYRSPLYDTRGRLTIEWSSRLKTFNGVITAAALLNVLDSELRLLQELKDKKEMELRRLLAIKQEEQARLETERLRSRAAEAAAALPTPEPTPERELGPLRSYTANVPTSRIHTRQYSASLTPTPVSRPPPNTNIPTSPTPTPVTRPISYTPATNYSQRQVSYTASPPRDIARQIDMPTTPQKHPSSYNYPLTPPTERDIPRNLETTNKIDQLIPVKVVPPNLPLSPPQSPQNKVVNPFTTSATAVPPMKSSVVAPAPLSPGLESSSKSIPTVQKLKSDSEKCIPKKPINPTSTPTPQSSNPIIATARTLPSAAAAVVAVPMRKTTEPQEKEKTSKREMLKTKLFGNKDKKKEEQETIKAA